MIDLKTGWRLLLIAGLTLASMPRAAQAQEWQSYAGAWRTTNVLRQFPYAQSIFFEFWANESGRLQGVAIFEKDGAECLGEMAPGDSANRLRFEPIDPTACDGFTGGQLEVIRAFTDEALMFMFIPDGVDDMVPLMSTHMGNFTKLAEAPENLRALVAGARSAGGSVADSIGQTVTAQAEALTRLREKLSADFQPHYPESGLIGVWRGYLADKVRRYPAEIALWTIRDKTLYEIGGALRFDDTGCAASIRVDDTSTRITFRTGPQQSSSDGSCDDNQLSGLVKLGTDFDTLAMHLQSSARYQDRLNLRNCIENLPIAESPDACEFAGLFTRSSASAAFDTTIASMEWTYDAPGPQPGHWDILKRDDAQLEQLRTGHEAALLENAAFFAELEKNYAEAEQQREQERRERIAASRAAEATAAARREQTSREWEARQSGAAAGGTPSVLPTLPKIDGPFRNLAGGDFLNALYRGDFDAVSTFDRYYGERKVQQRRALMGDTWADGIFDTAFRSYRLVDTVLAIYLFNFETEYSGCLRDDAVQFEVVTVVPDTVTRNLLGVEVARHYGGTTREYYWINKEFTRAFRRVGTTKPEGSGVAVSDLLLNQGGTDLRREILAGSKAMMKQFACDSEPVKRLEQSLLALASP